MSKCLSVVGSCDALFLMMTDDSNLGQAPPEKTKEAVMTAVKAGYRMLDCANDYDNEHVIGEALKELFAAGVVKREELFIQVVKLSICFFIILFTAHEKAKLWNSNHRPEHVRPDIMKTLEDLQVFH